MINLWQQIIIISYGLINLFVFLKGFYESKYKKNAFGLTRSLCVLGIFAWGDAVVFGLFWILTSIIALFLKDWYLFLLVISVFWVVRSLGETIYWFNQQFSVVNRNPPQKLPMYSTFHNDSVWFIHQILWQCTTVIAIISSIYLTKLWLQNLSF